MNREIILIGGGGHCMSVIAMIESTKEFIIKGILDVENRIGQKIGAYEIIGSDQEIAQLIPDNKYFLITVGQIKQADTRKQLYQQVINAGGTLVTVIAATAFVSNKARLAAGVVVGHQAVINAGASVGANAIINTGAIIEHDASIGDHCHISTGAVVNGACQVERGSFVGSNCVIHHGIKVGANGIIGAGTVVINDTEPNATYVGNPAVRKSIPG